MSFYNLSNGNPKLHSLVKGITDCDRRRVYYLSIATCYWSPTAAQRLIDDICANVSIEEIYVYMDRKEALRVGAGVLSDFICDNPKVQIYAIKADRLFHTKGYCLASYDEQDNIIDGCLAIGSANLTNSGLASKIGNIESIAVHSDLTAIQEFLSFFDNEQNYIELTDLTEFNIDDELSFQFALLQCALFSHAWSDRLTQYFSVQFQLNDEGRSQARSGIEPPVGFNVDTASISKSYIEFNLKDWQPENRKVLVRNYGIEGFLGYWIPKQIVDRLESMEDDLFSEFKAELRYIIESSIGYSRDHIRRDLEVLVQQGIVDEPQRDPIQNFEDRLHELIDDENEIRLRRIWSGRHFFDYPFALEDTQAIRDTFSDLLGTA